MAKTILNNQLSTGGIQMVSAPPALKGNEMGMIKDSLLESYNFLKEMGFKKTRDPIGRGDGWVRTITHNDGCEVLWITVDIKNMMLYLYNEWECGGELWDREIKIPDNAMENKESFIEWIDKEVDI